MKKYTNPRLNKGKVPTSIPKGSTKLKELAKNAWYVNYSFNGVQIRVKGNLNRIKDPREKELQAEVLLKSIKQDLEAGFNPNQQLEWVESQIKESTPLSEAILKFKEYHLKHNTRKKTIQTYLSKLNSLKDFFPDKLTKDFTTKDLQNFIQSKIDDSSYSQNSVKSAKRVFSTFFNVCKQLEIIPEKNNPMLGFDKKISSRKNVKKKHQPFEDEDLSAILEYLDLNDKYTAFFCRMIYYTCLRPAEIRGLKLENINLDKDTITIPFEIKKVTRNTKYDVIEINPRFKPYLDDLKISECPPEYYLTGSTKNIIGQHRIGENTPYNRFVSAIRHLKLDKKGYDLYSFKHTSNIRKYMSGWTLAEIMKANRHSSLSTTEIYLKELNQFVDIKTKDIPKI